MKYMKAPKGQVVNLERNIAHLIFKLLSALGAQSPLTGVQSPLTRGFAGSIFAGGSRYRAHHDSRL